MTCKGKNDQLILSDSTRAVGVIINLTLDAICDFQFQRAIRKYQLKTRELFIHLPLEKSNFNLLYNSKDSLVYLPSMSHMITN